MAGKHGLIALRRVVRLGLFAYFGGAALAAYRLGRPKRRFSYGVGPWLYGLETRDVFFPARGDATRISGWYMPAPGSQRAVILVHGKDVSRGMEFFGRFLELAADLHARGLSILMIDLRGHGLSGRGRFSFGLNERRDVLGAVDWLLARGYPAGGIGVLGVSLGSSACLGAAAEEPAIGAVVSDSGFAAIEPVLRAHWREESGLPDALLPGVLLLSRLLYGYDLTASRPEREMKRIRGAVLLIHGEEDALIPLDHARRLQSAAPHAELWVAPDAIHAGAYGVDPQAYLERVGGFFLAHLMGK